jgi:hypothetical protein
MVDKGTLAYIFASEEEKKEMTNEAYQAAQKAHEGAIATLHTKGPWAIDNDLAGYDITNRPLYMRVYAVDPGSDRDFTVGFVRDADPAVRAANGRVMAASVDLLAVLEEFVEDVETSYQHGDEFPDGNALEMLRVEWPDLAITYEKAVKAIAKAKG